MANDLGFSENEVQTLLTSCCASCGGQTDTDGQTTATDGQTVTDGHTTDTDGQTDTDEQTTDTDGHTTDIDSQTNTDGKDSVFNFMTELVIILFVFLRMC